MKRPGLALAASVLLSACSRAPSINVLGAFFPDWMFCIAGGIALTLIVRALLGRAGLGNRIGWPALVYTALTVLFSLAAWLLFFQH
ncbi:hypothetical protein JHS3_06510 [Jeongeupia sp. HS-3]|uniref:YtcA family lipoprotein n=1 Tax=Jeongeupia sp. HS-3 TaxID=1009682 RepID=UPI0018A550CC|nr:YtcA family lipoprotein [Jeongeupia sp. HS-3]BCL74915.1 hypothetical protein JHS3_06510 [Jeongeupia sp. HS-3]